MPIAHICQGCGHDLAEIRARIEPRYHLPIVRCDSCDRVSVRRPHPLFTGWMRLKKVDFALTTLVLQLLVSLFTLFIWCVVIPTLAATTYLRLHRHEAVFDLSAMILFVSVGVLATDTWLRVAFARCNYFAVLAWWSLIIFFGQVIAAGIDLWIARVSEGKLVIDIGNGPAIVGNDALSFASFSTGAAALGSMVAFLILSPLGYLLGNVMLSLLAAFRRHLRNRHRKSIRKLRAG